MRLSFQACFLFFSFSAFLICCADASTISINGNFNVADEDIDGSVYNISAMKASSSSSISYITGCTVSGEGLSFIGFSSSSESGGIPVFNLTMSNTTITNATIAIAGCYPPGSTLIVSHTAAAMQGSTPLFDLRNLVLVSYVMVFIVDTKVTWNKNGGGGDVILLGGASRQYIMASSGLSIYKVHATYASHVVHQVLPQCDANYCLDVYSGIFALDVATCESCTGEFLRSEQTGRFMSATNGGVIRISNCTSTGGHPFFYSAAESALELSWTGNGLLYGITTDSTLFATGSSLIDSKGTGYTSLMHISAASTGSTTLIPVVTSTDNTIWAGNITLSQTLVASIADLNANYIQTQYFLDAYSTIKAVKDSSVVAETVNSAASVFCVRPGVSKATWQVLDGWERAQCNCLDETYGPYCGPVVDPVIYYVSYNAEDTQTVCSVANCKTCLILTTDQCTECDVGYKLSMTACAAIQCDVSFCRQCSVHSKTTCTICNDEYEVATDGTCTAKKNKSKLSTGALVGVIVGPVCFVLVVVTVVIVVLCCCRKKQQKEQETCQHISANEVSRAARPFTDVPTSTEMGSLPGSIWGSLATLSGNPLEPQQGQQKQDQDLEQDVVLSRRQSTFGARPHCGRRSSSSVRFVGLDLDKDEEENCYMLQ